MKILLVLFLISVLFSSCNKDYFCDCTYYNEQGQVVGVPSEHHLTYYKRKDKSKAEQACKDMDFAVGTYGETSRKCELR